MKNKCQMKPSLTNLGIGIKFMALRGDDALRRLTRSQDYEKLHLSFP